MSRTILVTGGFGLVGREVANQLRARGDRVVTYDRDWHAGPDAVHGELYDVARLTRALSEHSIDGVIHTVAQSHPDLSLEIPLSTFEANLMGTISLLEACRLGGGVTRVVNYSSECAVGDRPDGPLTETATPNPTTSYGVTKLAGEYLGDVYRRRYQLEVVSLRVVEVYGPGLKLPSALAWMVNSAVGGPPFEMPTGGEHPVQLIHVRDVARASICALDAEPEHWVFNVTGGVRRTLSELAELVRRELPAASIAIGPGLLDADVFGRFDGTRARNELGYAPAEDLVAGI
ncbi:MAG: NAD-dependent epimerase/dehydratase family protein, partial [Solirubrobacteraceae bacterium]